MTLPRLRRLRLGVVATAFSAGALLIPPQTHFADLYPVGGGTDSRCWTYKASERGFARKINRERTAVGRRRLSLDPELSRTARHHTWEMTKKNLLHHTSSTGFRKRITDWSMVGENVGVGATVDSLHRAFMGSPPHRANVLYPDFRHVGVGVRNAGGRMWVTIIFSSGADPGTTLRMPRC